jgi:hypothetical protein
MLGPLAPTSNADTSAATVESSVVSFMTQQNAAYVGPVDGPFQDGVWTTPQAGCWACANGGPATAAATLYVLTGHSNQTLLDEAEQTIDTAIDTMQTPDGGFTPPAGDQPENIATMFFGVEFGTTYHLLAPYLSASTRLNWQASLAAAANYLINSGNTTWYSNGNINLGYTEFLYLVWQATGESQFETAYNASWSFTMDPPQWKFPGSGWVVVTPSTSADGVGGTGYFTEAGPGGNGYDAEYSMLQLDVASRLYLLSGDPRALYVANMLIDMETPLVNTTTWLINTSDGTRHTDPNREVGFESSAYAALGLEAGRSDLVSDILPELQTQETWYPEPNQADSPSFMRGFGNDISTIALAAAAADPALQATTNSIGVLGLAPATPPTTATTSTTTTTSATTTSATGPLGQVPTTATQATDTEKAVTSKATKSKSAASTAAKRRAAQRTAARRRAARRKAARRKAAKKKAAERKAAARKLRRKQAARSRRSNRQGGERGGQRAAPALK